MGLVLVLNILYFKIFIGGALSAGSVILPTLLITIGYLSILFGFLFDMNESNNIKAK